MTIHDLTHRVEPGMPVFPGDPLVTAEPRATHAADGYRVTALSLGTHAGTHVDAPSHTEPDGRDLDAFPPDRFRREALRVDCRDAGPRTAITRADLPDGSELPDEVGMIVLWTGWADHWGTDRYRDHPYLAPAAAEWCAEMGLDVAIDAFSPDPTPPADPGDGNAGDPGKDAADDPGNGSADDPGGVPAHHALLGGGQLIVENLRNLCAVPRRFRLEFPPLRVDADGAPVRAVAVKE